MNGSQTSIPCAVEYVCKGFLGRTQYENYCEEAPKKRPTQTRPHGAQIGQNHQRRCHHPPNGQRLGQHWNAGVLDKVVAAFAPDAVYLPPHHEAIHGRDAIREYLRGPLSHGVIDLAFDVTYIKQDGNVAWDVGTYRVNVPLNDGTKKEDHGKYLTVWKCVDEKWLIAADAWSSDLPASPLASYIRRDRSSGIRE